MAKVKQPLFSLSAVRGLGDDLVYKRGKQSYIVEKKPEPQDAKSIDQLSWRHMFQKVVALWHALSAAEKEAWESLGRKRHMTGYAWFISQALRPNPGIYLPLQGGIMQGIIDMDGYAIQDLFDPVNPQDADTEAARDAAIADALEDCIDSHIHGWDGADWQKLLTEDATDHNLRVKLYDGANGMDSALMDRFGEDASAKRGLYVKAQLVTQYSDTNVIPVRAPSYAADASSGAVILSTGLYGYNGVSFDRLRSYGVGILKVGRAEIGVRTSRRVGVGQVKGGPGVLYWMLLNPGAGNSLIELSNDLDGLSAIILDHFDSTRDGHMITFDPPTEFSTGIYLKTFTNMTSVTFGWI